jgi:hypothetical protein
MNLILLIQTKELADLPDMLVKMAGEVKRDISIMGENANACGVMENGDCFDFSVENKNYKNLSEWVDKTFIK